MKEWNWDVAAVWAGIIVVLILFWVGVALLLKGWFG